MNPALSFNVFAISSEGIAFEVAMTAGGPVRITQEETTPTSGMIVLHSCRHDGQVAQTTCDIIQNGHGVACNMSNVHISTTVIMTIDCRATYAPSIPVTFYVDPSPFVIGSPTSATLFDSRVEYGINSVKCRVKETSSDHPPANPSVGLYTVSVVLTISDGMVGAVKPITLNINSFRIDSKITGPYAVLIASAVASYKPKNDAPSTPAGDKLTLVPHKALNYDSVDLVFTDPGVYELSFDYMLRNYYVDIPQPSGDIIHYWGARATTYSQAKFASCSSPLTLLPPTSSVQLVPSTLAYDLSPAQHAVIEYQVRNPENPLYNLPYPFVPGDCISIEFASLPSYFNRPQCVLRLYAASHTSINIQLDFDDATSTAHQCLTSIGPQLQPDVEVTNTLSCRISVTSTPSYLDDTTESTDEGYIWSPDSLNDHTITLSHSSASFSSSNLVSYRQAHRSAVRLSLLASGIVNNRLSPLPHLVITLAWPSHWLRTLHALQIVVEPRESDSESSPYLLHSCALLATDQDGATTTLQDFVVISPPSDSYIVTPDLQGFVDHLSLQLICPFYRLAYTHPRIAMTTSLEVKETASGPFLQQKAYPPVAVGGHQAVFHHRQYELTRLLINGKESYLGGSSTPANTWTKASFDITLVQRATNIIYRSDALKIALDGGDFTCKLSLIDAPDYGFPVNTQCVPSRGENGSMTCPLFPQAADTMPDILPLSTDLVITVSCVGLFKARESPSQQEHSVLQSSAFRVPVSISIQSPDEYSSSTFEVPAPPADEDSSSTSSLTDAIRLIFIVASPEVVCTWSRHPSESTIPPLVPPVSDCLHQMEDLVCPPSFPCGVSCDFTLECLSYGGVPLTDRECLDVEHLFDRLDRKIIAACPACDPLGHKYGPTCSDLPTLTDAYITSVDDIPLTTIIQSLESESNTDSYDLYALYEHPISIEWEYSGNPYLSISISIHSKSLHPLTSFPIAIVPATDQRYTIRLNQLSAPSHLTMGLDDITISLRIGNTAAVTLTTHPDVTSSSVHLHVHPWCFTTSPTSPYAWGNPDADETQCGSHGTCHPTTGACQCDPGFAGMQCDEDEDVEPCRVLACVTAHTHYNPATGDGECILDDDGQHICNCQDERFFGDQCQHQRGCEAVPCVNGRLLSHEDDKTTCHCKCNSLFMGESCHRCSLQCQNGGVSNQHCTTCSCPYGYTGPFCQIPVWYHTFTLTTLPEDIAELIIEALASTDAAVAQQKVFLLQTNLVTLLLGDYNNSFRHMFVIVDDSSTMTVKGDYDVHGSSGLFDDNNKNGKDNRIRVHVDISKFQIQPSKTNPKAFSILIQLMLYPAALSDDMLQYAQQNGLGLDWDRIHDNLDFFKQFLDENDIPTNDGLHPDMDGPLCGTNKCDRVDNEDSESSNTAQPIVSLSFITASSFICMISLSLLM